jgi:hypothetical protein
MGKICEEEEDRDDGEEDDALPASLPLQIVDIKVYHLEEGE